MIRVALYQPDIPQNMGTILRLCACLNVRLHVIGPTGFDSSDRALKRASLDYGRNFSIDSHMDFNEFRMSCRAACSRLVLLTTKTKTNYIDFCFEPSDILLAGRESAGVPQDVHDASDERVTIPLHAEYRSLNVAVAVAMVLGEALRQTGGFSVNA